MAILEKVTLLGKKWFAITSVPRASRVDDQIFSYTVKSTA